MNTLDRMGINVVVEHGKKMYRSPNYLK